MYTARLGRMKHFLLASLASATAIAGAVFGASYLRSSDPWGLLQSLARWDGQHYRDIAETGYNYTPGERSNVAFFPAYPLLARAVARTCDIDVQAALLAVSNLCFAAALVAMGVYLHRGDGTAQAALAGLPQPPAASNYALLAMALLPPTFFFRMAYSESLFLLLAIGAMYAIDRSWPLLITAALVGLATSARPVGVAMLLPLAWHVWKRSDSAGQALRRLAYALPIGAWGLAAYMAFQWWRFGQPLAFALTQDNWRMRPHASAFDKWLSLLSWEPVWSAYVPNAWGYWKSQGMTENPLFNWQFATPIYWVGTIAAVVVGGAKRWLTSCEVLFCASLLAVCYFGRAYEMCMASQARFVTVLFPVYIVLGHLLAKLPPLLSMAVLACSGALMGAYAALFAAGYPLF